MSEFVEKIKEQIDHLREKRPMYRELLDFCEKIIEAQEESKPGLNVAPVEIREDVRTLQMKEGFPLVDKADFSLNFHSSVMLFESLCQIGKNATETMRENIQTIERAMRDGTLNLEELLRRHFDEGYLKEIIKDLKIDERILKFLIHMSILPSLTINVTMLKDRIDLRSWLKGYCPICGSLPQISELREEGQRYLLCSFCGFIWPTERLMCPFCENRDHESLHYFYVEGQEGSRIDACDKCKQYIKTVDARKLDYEPDLNLEDITTLHLDILASEKGFRRPVPNPWGP